MSRKPKNQIFIDTSFFFALVCDADDFHEQAIKLWEGPLKSQNTRLVTSNFLIDELFTLIRSKRGRNLAKAMQEILATSSAFLKIMRVSSKDESKVWDWFYNDWRDLSYTDCVSFAQMRRLGLKEVATFDNHFTRAGFKVVK